ncbi:MAG: outer membrane beta-barrel protein [Candidatus Eisenbacteria bacterium]|nr:outer membrane beta-barrel protein [Candidatus Eisenbacteria bacterium]
MMRTTRTRPFRGPALAAVPALLILVALAALPVRSAAQSASAMTRPLMFGVGGGVTVPVSDVKSAFKTGMNLKAFARLKVPGLPFSARAEVGLQRFNLDSASVHVSGDQQLISGLAMAQWDFISLGPVHPYLIAGLGAYSVKTSHEGEGEGSETSTRFGINGGAGVTVALGRISLFAEGRVDNVYTDRGVIDTKTIRYVPVTFGILF